MSLATSTKLVIRGWRSFCMDLHVNHSNVRLHTVIIFIQVTCLAVIPSFIQVCMEAKASRIRSIAFYLRGCYEVDNRSNFIVVDIREGSCM